MILRILGIILLVAVFGIPTIIFGGAIITFIVSILAAVATLAIGLLGGLLAIAALGIPVGIGAWLLFKLLD